MKKLVSLLLCVLMLGSPLLSAAEETSEHPFFSALQEFIQSLSLEKTGHNISAALPEGDYEAILRQDPGVTELAVGDIGKIQLTSRHLLLDIKGVKAAFDYGSILNLVKDWEQIGLTREYLTDISHRALQSLILPFVDTIQSDDGISVHMDFDGMRFMNNLYLLLKDIVREEEFRLFYESAGPFLHQFFSDLPERADALPDFLDRIFAFSRILPVHSTWRFNADFHVIIDRGAVRNIFLDGSFSMAYWGSTSLYPIRFEYSSDGKGFSTEAEINLPFGALSFSYDGKNLSLSFLNDRWRRLCEMNGILNLTTGKIDLEVYLDGMYTSFRVSGFMQKDELDLTVSYYDDLIYISMKKEDRYIHCKLKSVPYWDYNYLGLDYDLKIMEEPNHEYSISVRGSRTLSWESTYDSYYLLVGPSRVVFSIHPDEYRNKCLDGQVTFNRSDTSVDFGLELQQMNNIASNPTPYKFHLSGGNRMYTIEFSYPYSLWKVEGTATVQLDQNNWIQNATARAVTSYYYDPSAPESVTNLIYNPGRLTVTSDQGVYILEKTKDTSDALIYQLKRNLTLMGELKMNLTDDEFGKTLSAEIFQEEKPFARLQIQPVGKPPIELINEKDVITVDWNFLKTMLPLLIQGNTPVWK